MRSLIAATALALVAIPALGAGTASASQEEYDRGYALGLDAYRYGLPLVSTNKTFLNQTSIDVPNGRGFGPVNRFNHARSFTEPEDRSVVAPNLDTLYSIAWLNVKKQPQVIGVPKIKNRYWVIPLMSPYTEDFKNLGSVNETKPGDYAVVGPNSRKVDLPKGVRKVRSDYDRVWIITRIYADNDSPADIERVNEIQDELTITPLSKYGKKGWKPKKPKDPDTTIDDPGLPSGMSFYDAVGKQLEKFPPPPADDPELERLSLIGVGPGAKPSTDASLPADTVRGMTDAAAAGPASVLADVTALYAGGFEAHNGYLVTPTGRYGTDYRLRAGVTQVGLGALTPDEAIYPFAQVDRSFAPLTGDARYVLHIPAGQLPPVDAFWSLTLYDLAGFFVVNPIDRHVINDRTDLAYNADGSLDLYVQSTEPADPLARQNWLPSPPGERFRMIWRLYATEPDRIAGVLDGTGWTPPAINAMP